MLLVQGLDVLSELVDAYLQPVVLGVLIGHRHQLLMVLLELTQVLLVYQLVLPDFELVLVGNFLALLAKDNVTALYHATGVSPELLSGEESSEKDECSVLRVFEVQAVGQGYDEQRHEENAPEGCEDTDYAAAVGLWVVVAIAYCGQSNDDIPHSSVDVLEIDIHFSFEDLEAQTQLNQREQERVKHYLDWILDHQGLKSELEVCVDSKDLAAPLRLGVGPLGELYDVDVGRNQLEEDLQDQKHVVNLEVEVR